MTNERLVVLEVVTDSFSAFEFVAPLMMTARTEGVECVLLCSGRSYDDAKSFMAELDELGLVVHDVPFSRSMMSFRDDYRSLVRVLQLIRRIRPGVVHTHLGKAGILGRVAALISGAPSVHTVYDFAFFDAQGWRRHVLLWMERAMAHFTKRIFFVSEHEYEVAISHRIGSPEKMQVVGNGIRLDQFDPARVDVESVERLRARYGIAKDRTVIGTVARLVPRKGIDTLLEATARVIAADDNVHVLIVGGGPLEAELAKLANELGIAERVTFTGFIEDQDDMPGLYSVMDIFCLPTRREGYGMAIVEASAMRRPVVASDIRPVDAVVHHGRTGLLATVDDPASFADALSSLVAAPSLRAQMGDAGHEFAFASENFFDSFPPVLAAYREVGHEPKCVPPRFRGARVT